MPNVDFSNVLTNLAGEPLTEGKAEVTLKLVACNTLLASYNDEPNLSGEEKVKRFSLALKVHEGTAIDLSSEEIVLLKRLIAKAYSPLIVGRAFAILEPTSIVQLTPASAKK